MQAETPGLASYIAILSRRKWLLLLAVLAITGLSAALAFGLPAVYRSTATILIEQQEIPQELVRSTITTFADQRIQLISQRIMTRDNLLNVIEKFDLYASDRENKSTESLLARIRKDINLETVSADVIDPRSGRPVAATIAFTLAYDSSAPQLAQKVSEQLVSLFLDENVKSRTETATQTSDFLAEEAQKLRTTVAELETKIAEFKEANTGALPELTELNMQLMDRAQRELADVEREMRTLDERKIFLRSELAQTQRSSELEMLSDRKRLPLDPAERLRALKSEHLSVSSIYGPRHPDLLRLTREIESLERELGISAPSGELQSELARVRTELSGARQRYADNHPDVIRLGRAEQQLRWRLRKAPQGARSATVGNPAYTRLQAEYNAADNQLLSLERKKRELEARLDLYEQRLTRTPQVERAYSALVRDHENAIAKYKEIRDKQSQAQLAQALEMESKGERFTLIEAPQLPEEPIKPHRMGILVLGILFSLAGGLGTVSLAERVDDTVRDRSDLASLSEFPTLATVPYIESQGGGMRRMGFSGLAALGVFLVVAAGAFLVHKHVMPLNELWGAALDRLRH